MTKLQEVLCYAMEIKDKRTDQDKATLKVLF